MTPEQELMQWIYAMLIIIVVTVIGDFAYQYFTK